MTEIYHAAHLFYSSNVGSAKDCQNVQIQICVMLQFVTLLTSQTAVPPTAQHGTQLHLGQSRKCCSGRGWDLGLELGLGPDLRQHFPDHSSPPEPRVTQHTSHTAGVPVCQTWGSCDQRPGCDDTCAQQFTNQTKDILCLTSLTHLLWTVIKVRPHKH